eukprot:1949010-Amphidinium_carterae.1
MPAYGSGGPGLTWSMLGVCYVKRSIMSIVPQGMQVPARTTSKIAPLAHFIFMMPSQQSPAAPSMRGWLLH